MTISAPLASSAAALNEKMSKLGTNLLTAAPGQDYFGQDAKLPETAVPMAKRLVAGGIRAIWNFAPVRLRAV